MRKRSGPKRTKACATYSAKSFDTVAPSGTDMASRPCSWTGGWVNFHELAELINVRRIDLFWEVCCGRTGLFQPATSVDDFVEDETYRYSPPQLIRAAGMHPMPFIRPGRCLGAAIRRWNTASFWWARRRSPGPNRAEIRDPRLLLRAQFSWTLRTRNLGPWDRHATWARTLLRRKADRIAQSWPQRRTARTTTGAQLRQGGREARESGLPRSQRRRQRKGQVQAPHASG